MSTRLQQEYAILNQIKTSLTIMGTILDPEKTRTKTHDQIVYVSHAITSGKKLYEQFKKHHVTSLEALHRIDPTIYLEKVMQSNIQEGVTLGRQLRKNGYKHVIVPGTFFAEGWTQEHYMSLWRRVIENYADVVYFNNGWEFTNGGAEEFLIGLQSKKVLKEHGTKQPLTQRTGVEKIRNAIEYIDNIGANPQSLLTIYRELLLHQPKHMTFAFS